MTVNTNYKGVALPFASYPLLDDQLSTTFEPIQGLDALARQLSIAQFPGALVTVEGGVNVVTKPPRQNPGRREVIGIIDAASAARFLLPTASLQNAVGAFVAPTAASLKAGVKHAAINADGVTRSVDLTSKDPPIYPLTLLGLRGPVDPGRQGLARADGQLPGLRRRAGPGAGRRDRPAPRRARAADADARGPAEGRADRRRGGSERRTDGRAHRGADRDRRASPTATPIEPVPLPVPLPTVPVDVPAPDAGAEPSTAPGPSRPRSRSRRPRPRRPRPRWPLRRW